MPSNAVRLIFITLAVAQSVLVVFLVLKGHENGFRAGKEQGRAEAVVAPTEPTPNEHPMLERLDRLQRTVVRLETHLQTEAFAAEVERARTAAAAGEGWQTLGVADWEGALARDIYSYLLAREPGPPTRERALALWRDACLRARAGATALD